MLSFNQTTSSQNAFMEGLQPWVVNTGLETNNQINHRENAPITTVWPKEVQTQKVNQKITGSEIKKTIQKKAKRVRTAYTTDQIKALERTFSKTKYIDTETRQQLAECLNIGEKSIKIWFQNRRMKEKKESESSCDSSVSESVTTSVSPPLSHQPNIEGKDEHCDVMTEVSDIPYSELSHLSGEVNAPQYQLPCQYEGYVQYPNNSHISTNMFCYDTNVYPTQYYPLPENYSQNHYNYNQNYDNEWTYNNFEPRYYY